MQLKYFLTFHEMLDETNLGLQVKIPESVIVKNLSKDLIVKKSGFNSGQMQEITFGMFRYLYRHYIGSDSLSTINVSYDIRISIDAKMEQLDLFEGEINRENVVPSPEKLSLLIVDLVHTFDTAGRDILQLLRGDCYVRFMSTEVFQKITSHLQA